jgi:hypothetical protein
VRFNAFACTFISFNEKILNSKSSPFSKFICEIQCIFMHFHQISWKNIEFWKFTIFQVQMWDSMHFHALSSVFMKKYWILKVHLFFLFLGIFWGGLAIFFCSWNSMIGHIWNNFSHREKNLKYPPPKKNIFFSTNKPFLRKTDEP